MTRHLRIGVIISRLTPNWGKPRESAALKIAHRKRLMLLDRYQKSLLFLAIPLMCSSLVTIFVDALAVCLAMLGGYGLPKPEMNATIKLDNEARTIARKSYCEGDLCWPEAKLDIEYHGEVHVGAAQMKSDVGRELGIEHMGWQIITITSPQVFDADQFETVAKAAATALRKRLRPTALEATLQHNTLREKLEQWMLELQ